MRAPAAEVPQQTDMAECSISTGKKFGQMLDDVGLGRDGVGGHDVRVAEADGLGDGGGRFHSDAFFGHQSTSSIMLMQAVGHSWGQMPQPLQ